MQTVQQTASGPYSESSTNLIYNLLFCDDSELYQINAKKPYTYPFNIIFSDDSSIADLQTVIDDIESEPRVKILAYNKQMASGFLPSKFELLAVIVEVGLENGLDVLASFNNGTARYITQTGKILIWETTTDETANKLTNALFVNSENLASQIGPWDKPRLAHPSNGNVRLTFLVSDGLYFGEGSAGALFNDPMAKPTLQSATQLLQYITEKSLESENAN